MQIRFCSLYSGSSGNATYIQCGNTRLLLDAGLTGKCVEQALCAIGVSPAELNAILVTHEHTDHIKGVGVLARRYRLPVYANAATWSAMDRQLGQTESWQRFVFSNRQDFYIRDIGVQPVPIPHDAADPVGYCLFGGARKLTVLTDLGHYTDKLIEAASGSDVLLLESNHDIDMLKNGPYPRSLKQRILGRKGHLSNDDASQMLCTLAARGVRQVLLGHLSRDNNRPELAYETSCRALCGIGARVGEDIRIVMTSRDRVTPEIVL